MTSAKTNARLSIDAELHVHRLGFGAMQLTGPGIWGQPRDRSELRSLLRELCELGIDFIDTADSYGPHVSEELIAEELWPYRGLHVATKGGLVRHGPDLWEAVGRPEYLRQCVLMSLRRLKLDQLELWQLHRIDPKVPRDEQFDVVREMQREGLIRHVGLSEVSCEDLRAAAAYFRVATVQNRYSLSYRQSEAVLDYCTERGICFIPWYPLEDGRLLQAGGILEALARRVEATPAQLALAWLLQRSPIMLPIPGTRNVRHLRENAAAVRLEVSPLELQRMDGLGRAAWQAQVNETRQLA